MKALTAEERAARLVLLERFGGEASRLRRVVRQHGSGLRALPFVPEGRPVASLDRPPTGASGGFGPDGAVRGVGDAVFPGDPGWPARLDGAPDPPVVVFARGRWPLGRRTIAIVGARDADEYGRAITRRLAQAAADEGWVVVSGGARGVDGIAHTAALDAGGGTVVVLGGGLERPYPAEHRGLFVRAAEAGMVLTEYPAWRTPRGRQFPERNRLVAALGDVVLVTQARGRSGALATARVARELGRPVLAVPGDVCYRLGSGVAGLLATGATAVVGPAHLRRVLCAIDRGAEAAGAGWPPDPEPEARRGPLPGGWTATPVGGAPQLRDSSAGDGHAWLTASLRDGGVPLVDDVVEQSGRPTAEVLRAIVSLELEGVVERVAGGRVRLSSR